MSQIKPAHLIISLAMAIALGGCGDKNDKAVFSPESGHLSGWKTAHNTPEAGVESCVECHGVNYDGGVSKVSCMSSSAVSGISCHTTNPVGTTTKCVSCHGGLPSGPFGSAAPNRKLAHTKHLALTGITCATCHQNAGSGTAGHARATSTGSLSRATVALTTYSAAHTASTGSFGFSATDSTCSQISCHGGKVTPAWTSTINLVASDNTICYQCHAAGYEQFNGFDSGTYSGTSPVTNLHTSHVTRGSSCTDCHNIGALNDYQKHFSGITTKRVIAPANTIGGSPTQIGSYTVSTKTCNNVACHDANIKTTKWLQ